jgi:DNA-binding response OmpR family regulator
MAHYNFGIMNQNIAPSRGTLFVINPRAEFQESTQRALEEAGFIVFPTRDGDEAISQMTNLTGPALAIIDIKSPEIKGWDFISSMRSNKELAHIPILVVTPKTYEAIKGAQSGLRKPLALEKLLGAIEGLMAQVVVWSMIG